MSKKVITIPQLERNSRISNLPSNQKRNTSLTISANDSNSKQQQNSTRSASAKMKKTYTIINPKQQQIKDLKKENFENKNLIGQIKNRITLLRKEENIYNKKLIVLREKKEKQDQIKEERNIRKQAIIESKNKEEQKILNKKKKNKKMKEKNESGVKNSINNNLQKKKENYKSAMKDRELNNKIVAQFDKSYKEINSKKSEMLKQKENEYQAKKVQEQIEKEIEKKRLYETEIKNQKEIKNNLKETFDYYESLERECVEKLKKTVSQSNGLISFNDKILNIKSKKQKVMSNSMIGFRIKIDEELN